MSAKILAALCLLLALVLVAIALRPDLDLDVARRFYVGSDHFVGDTPAGVIVRYVAWALPFATFLGLVAAALAARAGVWPRRYAPRGRSLAMLVLSLALGPGLLVHGTLKEISHRPRPYSVTEFGGPDRFRPFIRFDGACRHNCSFASGETAAAAWMLAPASLVPPPWGALATAGALVFTAAVGLGRMAFGGHFLSDVCAAALITILVVLALRRAFGIGRGRDRDRATTVVIPPDAP